MRYPKFVLIALSLCCGSAGAQQVLVDRGSRIRFTTAESHRWVTAVVVDAGGDSIRVDGGPMMRAAYHRSELREVQVSLGRNHLSGIGRGVLVGAGLGAVVGFGLGLGEDCENDFICIGPGGAAVLMAIPGAGAGAVLGGLIGVERWHSGVLPSRPQVSLLVGRGIGLSVPWPR
jgi:hypothetical protein